MQALAQIDASKPEVRPVEISLTPITRSTIRISILPLIDGVPRPVPVTGALTDGSWPAPVARFRGGSVSRDVKCGDLNVKITQPLTLRIERPDRRVAQELIVNASSGEVTFRLGDGPIFGLGQGGPQFDRKGQLDKMASGQAGYRLGTHGAKEPIPLAIGTSGWALFIHQPSGAFDLTGSEGVFRPAAPESGLPLDIFVIAAKEPSSVLREYSAVTGFPVMPPLWSLGYQQSHRTLGPADEILAEARMFREKKLPCDTMIYLGTGFCPNGWNTDNGEFAWNSKAFPNPQAAIDGLHKENFKVVLHVVLEGHHLTGTVNDNCTTPPQPSGRDAQGHWPPDRQVSCYWPFHKPLSDMGIDGWWPDQGDGLDAPSRLARNRMYFEGQQLYRPDERVFALHRNCYAGMQRYGAFLWSGDVQSTWETLKTHVPVGINAGLSGIPYWGTDIGGFIPTKDFTGELYARWFQFAAFTPLFRSHGRDWRLHMPTGWNTGEIGIRETNNFHPDPSELRDPSIEPVCRKYLELRYRLMPYLYSAVKETCETGMPIMRAMWLHYPQDQIATARGDQYLYGRDILVAPVVEKGATTRSVWLPAGDWYDFWTKEKFGGGREISRKVDLETIPLFIRAGTVLTMGPVRQYTSETVEGPLELFVYPGADGEFSLYRDDGRSFDYTRGVWSRLNISWNNRGRTLSLRLAPGSRPIGPVRENIVAHVVGETAAREIDFRGAPIQLKI
ncbi:MAG TPA: TIM-barrel domain-containing protein [Bryobacteraceae bacterium]|nr:TIM-barrel domain-containing protein [Bryobacteraceae bacterium]